ncbi:MAG: chorismate-binding protein, partial [Phycisphaerales bacterium]|nr:chorismate-binding protein [Phycisphaerales bacterium]
MSATTRSPMGLHHTLDTDACPVAVYEALYDRAPETFLYESLQTDGERGRYSFLGGAPRAIALLADGVTTITRDGVNRTSELSFADACRALLGDLPALPEVAPFAGGLVGFLSYDYARQIERIPDANPDTLNLPDALMMAPGELVIIDHIERRTDILLSGASATQDRVDHIASLIRASADQPITPEAAAPTGELDPARIRASMTRDDYEAAVVAAKAHIVAGDIFQIVPSQRFSVDLPCDALTLYRALRITNPSPYMYYLNFDAFQIVGSSPEMVVQCADRRARIRPLAGTRKRGQTPEEDAQLESDLRGDAKECAEHVMLVDLARNDLGRVCEFGGVTTSDLLDVERYARVMHIVSNVDGRIDKKHDALSALVAGFPAGTVSGAPKVRAMEI